MVTRTKKKVAKKKATKKKVAKKTTKKTDKKTSNLDHGHSKFNDKLIPVIKNLAYRGKTHAEIAELLGVAEKTFYNWKNNSDDLRKALEEAKGNPIQKVEKALIERALGYSTRETKVNMSKSGVVKSTDVIKHYPPDVTAIKYYLGNKDPDNWKEKQEIDLGNKDGEEFKFAFDLSKKPTHRDVEEDDE